MKAKKIAAFAMAVVMSTSVAATTALSVSADNTVIVTSTVLDWGNRATGATYNLTDVALYKTDFSDVSMSNGAIRTSTISYDGTNYTITINFQKVTKSVTIGSTTLTNATAVVTDVDASGYGGTALSTAFTYSEDGYSTAVITIPSNTAVDDIPEFSYPSDEPTETVDPDYGITLDFQTSFDKSLLNLIPAMTSPSAEMTFSIGV